MNGRERVRCSGPRELVEGLMREEGTAALATVRRRGLLTWASEFRERIVSYVVRHNGMSRTEALALYDRICRDEEPAPPGQRVIFDGPIRPDCMVWWTGRFTKNGVPIVTQTPSARGRRPRRSAEG